MKSTPAFTLLNIVWSHGKKDSWERINHSMRNALSLAIGSGLQFVANDFKMMSKLFRAYYWIGESSEWIYSSAVTNGNMSCVQAYEEHRGRKPFFASKVATSQYCDGSYLHANSIERQRERLFVGANFPMDERHWHVTGFDDVKGVVRLASYAKHWPEGKPQKLLKLTHEQILEIFPAPKKKKKTLDSQAKHR